MRAEVDFGRGYGAFGVEGVGCKLLVGLGLWMVENIFEKVGS